MLLTNPQKYEKEIRNLKTRTNQFFIEENI